MEFNGLIAEIKSVLDKNPTELAQEIEELLPQVFDIRLKSLKWIDEIEQVDSKTVYNDIDKALAPLTSHPQHGVLAENCAFAIRSNERVLSPLLSELGGTFITENIKGITQSEFNYVQLMSVLQSISLLREVVKYLKEWIHASLRIELILLALFVIDDEKQEVDEHTIDKLSEMVATNGQDFYAIAKHLGLVQKRESTYG